MLSPKIPPNQLPEQWRETDSYDDGVTFGDGAGRCISLRKRRGGSWRIRFFVTERHCTDIEAGTVISETAAANRPVAIATAIGFMEQTGRLEQSYLS